MPGKGDMGDCKSCKKDCPSAGESQPQLPRSSGRSPVKRDLVHYLKNKPKSKGDNTPLNYPCPCLGSPSNMARYTCMNCLRSWALASTDEEIEKQIVELRERRSRIAADRLERIHKEIKWSRRIEDE